MVWRFRITRDMGCRKMMEKGTRERLLETAGEVFAEYGLHGATIREITSRAGANVAAVNYYFRDKEELYAAVLEHAHRNSLTERWMAQPGGSPEERVRGFIEALLRQILDPSRPKWHGVLMTRELASPTPMLQRLIEERLRPRCQVLMEAIQEMAGSLTQRKLQLIVSSILGQCFFYRHSRVVAESLFPELYQGRDGLKEIVDHISNFSIAAIRFASIK
jgi:AcrR family transcriptional regulator